MKATKTIVFIIMIAGYALWITGSIMDSDKQMFFGLGLVILTYLMKIDIKVDELEEKVKR